MLTLPLGGDCVLDIVVVDSYKTVLRAPRRHLASLYQRLSILFTPKGYIQFGYTG